MKQIFNIISACTLLTVFFVSCEKDAALIGSDTSEAYVSFTNVNATGKTVNFFINGSKLNLPVTVAAVTPGASIIGLYAGVMPGKASTFTVSDTTPPNPVYYSTPFTVAAAKSYSFYLYDTLVGTAGQLKGILLNTDRTIDANSLNANIRALHFNPKAPALDVVIVRQVANNPIAPALPVLVPKDSVLISSGISYIGSSVPNITTLSAFIPVMGSQLAGSTSGILQTNYIAKVKLAGTQTVLATGTYTLVPGRNYSLLLRGNSATAFTLTLQANN